LGKICAFLAFSAVTIFYHDPSLLSHSIYANPVEVFYTAGSEKKSIVFLDIKLDNAK